jgi:hypothetical protein
VGNVQGPITGTPTTPPARACHSPRSGPTRATTPFFWKGPPRRAAKKAGNNAQVVSLCGDQPLADAAAQPLHSSKQSMIQERVRAGIADDRVARAEQIVEMLRSRYRFNEQRAVLLLDSSRRLDFDNGDCPEMTTVLQAPPARWVVRAACRQSHRPVDAGSRSRTRPRQRSHARPRRSGTIKLGGRIGTFFDFCDFQLASLVHPKGAADGFRSARNLSRLCRRMTNLRNSL